MTDFAKYALLAQVADAAYQIDPANQKKAIEALGMKFVAAIGNPDDDAQAIVADWNGTQIISLSGTRFDVGPTEGRVKEDFDNIDLLPIPWGTMKLTEKVECVGFAGPRCGGPNLWVSGNGHAARGYAKRLLKVMNALLAYIHQNQTLILTGHSAGACQANLLGAKICAKPDFIQFANDGDVFFDWGWPWSHPVEKFIRLPDGAEATSRPGLNLSVEDHFIPHYIAALQALALKS